MRLACGQVWATVAVGVRTGRRGADPYRLVGIACLAVAVLRLPARLPRRFTGGRGGLFRLPSDGLSGIGVLETSAGCFGVPVAADPYGWIVSVTLGG